MPTLIVLKMALVQPKATACSNVIVTIAFHRTNESITRVDGKILLCFEADILRGKCVGVRANL